MSIPSLKRPRSTSQSPSASSSPKRANSEDTAPSSDNGHQDLGLLTAMHQPPAAGSSPLRLDSEADETGWVKRTEDVHIGELDAEADGDMDVEEGEDDSAAARYGQLLAALPPPFDLFKRYYIVPTEVLDTVKSLAHGGSGSKDAAEGSLPRLDLSKLIADPAGQSVYAITTELDASGKTELSEKGREEILWQVRAGLVEDEEFKFVSEAGWKLLLEWYGPYDGPSLGRFCYDGDRVEMIPSVYTLHIVERVRAGPVFPQAPSDSPAKPIRITCPPTTKLTTFVSFVKSAIADHLDEDAAVRVWQLEVGETNGTLPDLSALRLPANLLPSLSGGLLKDDAQNLSIAELGLVNGDVLAAEIGRKQPVGGESWVVGVNEEGKAVEKTIPAMTVPTAPAPLFSKPAFFGGSGASNVASTSSNTGMQTRSQTKTESRNTKGLVGLVNLGNTCFMNSAVQCLSNTPELNEYFLSGVYREELNPDNPLGMGGQIAKAFGETIETLWRGSSSSFTPRDLKWKTGRFAPQFVGYGQHDTQEFIAFLLDGLHEDLNRIQKKPYIEKPDWKPGGGNKELAELGKECWEGYKKRNDSVIVDLFQGQLKSTLVCPECRKESITLDPFMYLTVPLPIAQIRVAKFDFVPLDPAQPPRHVKLLLPTNASWGQLKEKLALLAGCPSTNLVGIDLWQSGVYRWWRDPDLASEAGSSDLPVFYETAAPISASRKAVGIPATESTVTVPVYTFRNPDQRGARFRHDPSYDIQPFFITLTKAEASDPVAVREAITKGYSRWVKEDARDDLWVHSGSRRAARALPVVEDEEEEPVAEIHLDGDETRVVEVPPRSAELEAESSQSTDSTYLNSPLQQRNASFASISDAASMRSHKSGKLVPRGDLFKVFVSEASTSEDHSGLSLSGTFGKKEPPVAPLWRGSLKNASNAWSALESRKKQKKGMLGHLKSMVSSSYQSDDEASPPATPTSAPACVRPGEGIFCEWEQEQFEEFFEMAETSKMDMETLEDPAIAKEMERRKAGQNITLDDCLDEFSKEETLGQEDLWYCPQCKKHQAATKKLEIYQAPDILVICLKRFGSSRRLTDKLDQHVSFPMEGLDLSDRIDERKIAKSLDLNSEDMAHYGFTGGDEPIVYDLYAVDNHFGGLGGGHYTAFCRNKVDGEWYNYDDSRVSKASPDAVESRAAYLLFYRRRTSRPIGGLSRVKAEQASRAASPAPSSTDLSSAETGPVSHVLARERNSSGGSTSSTDAIGSNDDEADMDPPGPWSPLHNWADNVGASPLGEVGNDADGELPGYGDTMDGNMNVNMNTPPSNGLPSPAVSDEGDVDTRNETVPDYTAIGAQIGFGNNAWGAATKAVNGGGPGEAAYTAEGEGFVERNGAGAGMIQLTPPDSEDGFEKIRARPNPALAAVKPVTVPAEGGEKKEGGAGGEQVVAGGRDVDEDYDMVKKEEGTE